MGSSASKQDDSPLASSEQTIVFPPASTAIIQAQAAGRKAAPGTTRVIDYIRLPQPVKYEELSREAWASLKPDLFEGLRFDLTKPLNQNFGISHSIFMGNVDVPSQTPQPLKTSIGQYEFGANLISNQGNFMLGRVQTDGRVTGRIKYDVNPFLSLKLQMLLNQEAEMSQGMLDIDTKGADWNSQLKLGNQSFYGLNYFQSVTPSLALGGEMFWLGKQRKSGTGFAARHTGDKHVATCQIATTGLANLTYLHRLSDKINLATDFMWNWNVREATASFGYDYTFRQGRLWGKIDTDGKIGAYLEEKINPVVNFLLSAELDHVRKDYKFGFGMRLGE